MDKYVVCYGEVLWDNLPEGRRIGGAPLNVSYHLNMNGMKSQMISQVGKDLDGEELLNGINGLGVDSTYIEIAQDAATSTVEVHLEKDGKVSYEIVAPVAWDYIEYDERIAQVVSKASAFVFGSLAARNEKSRDTLLKYLKVGTWTIFDVNLRKPFYQQSLINLLIEHSKTLKLNDEELELLLEWNSIDASEETNKLKALLDKFDTLEDILLTKGAEGAVYCSRTECIEVPGISVSVKDTVGSGDSFLGAFIAMKLNGASTDEAISHAVKISAFVATQTGACPVYPKIF